MTHTSTKKNDSWSWQAILRQLKNIKCLDYFFIPFVLGPTYYIYRTLDLLQKKAVCTLKSLITLSLVLVTTQSISLVVFTDYGHPEGFFSKIRNFWAWADKLG